MQQPQHHLQKQPVNELLTAADAHMNQTPEYVFCIYVLSLHNGEKQPFNSADGQELETSTKTIFYVPDKSRARKQTANRLTLDLWRVRARDDHVPPVR